MLLRSVRTAGRVLLSARNVLTSAERDEHLLSVLKHCLHLGEQQLTSAKQHLEHVKKIMNDKKDQEPREGQKSRGQQ